MWYLINGWVFSFLFFNCLTQDTDPKNGYIFTSAKVLKKGEENKLYLRRIGNLDEGTLNVTLLYRSDFFSVDVPQISQEFPVPSGEAYTTFNWLLDNFETDYSYGTLKINGIFGDYSFTGNDTVKFVYPKPNIVIIQTDKPVYQPGQTVKFRILKVNKDFKPGNEDNTANAYVADPMGTHLFHFEDIELVKGIAQNEFKLSEEPSLGTWSINVSVANEFHTTEFAVDEFDPPTFEVKLNLPSFILSTEENILIEVCAKYKYGLPVTGMLNFTAFSLHSLYAHYGLPKKPVPTMDIYTQIHGCYQVDLYVPLIEPGNVYTYSKIQISAQVIEDGTGAKMEVKQYLERTTMPLILEFFDSLEYYKPGMPYNGKLKVLKPDNTPAENETIEICTWIDKERSIAVWYAMREIEICSNFTSNLKGVILYTFLPQNLEDVSITLKAKSLAYLPQNSSDTTYRASSLEQPAATKHLKAYYSPTNSYIQIQAFHQPVKCGTKQTLKVFYTADESSTDFQFFYQIIYQEAVMLEDSVTESYKPQADIFKKFKNSNAVIKGEEFQIEPSSAEIGNQSNAEFLNSSLYTPTNYQPHLGKVEVTIQIRQYLAPEFVFLIYYIKDNREIIADSMKIAVDKCFKNKVDFFFGDKKKEPGSDTDIYIKASPNSFCGIKAIDQSDTIVNSGDQITPDKLYQLRTSLFNDYYRPSNPCYSDIKQPGLDNNAFKNMTRPPIGKYGTPNYVDSFAAFQDSSVLVISDLFLVTRPCKRNKKYPASYYDDEYINEDYFGQTPAVEYTYGDYGTEDYETSGSESDERMYSDTQIISGARTNPETWLFEMDLTGPDGAFITKKQLPDTITDWVGRAICLNLKDGLGISNDTYISSYKSFSIDYTLPFSIIRGEELTLVVTVLNYESGALPVAITVDNPGFTKISSNKEVCVDPEGKTTFPIVLKASELGEVNVTVRAETTSTHGICGGSSISNTNAKDTVTKPIQIMAEGYPVEKVISILAYPSISAKNVFQTKVTFTTPKNVVPGSDTGYVDFVGDILGPAINNLQNLVSLPTQGGELNMINFVPSYLVLDYLTEIGLLTEDIKNRATNNLNTAYQREMKYRHDDGSFSTFGDADEEGSMFLTAFVLRSFYEAQDYILIEDSILRQMQDWIVSKQLDNGCFPNTGQIIDFDVQDGLTYGNSTGSTTAYVLASLVITEFDNISVINKAFKCLKENYPADPHTQLMYSYTEALINKLKEAQMHMDDARRHLNKTGAAAYFAVANGTKSKEIEATAYAVLSTLEMGKDPTAAFPYVNFLTKTLSPYGGFISIQDTCIGLEALTKFLEYVYGDSISLQIETTGGLQETVSLNDDNRFSIQRFKVSDTSSKINILARGSGYGLLQAVHRYNTKVPPESTTFSIEVSGKCLDKNCKNGIIDVSVAYLPTNLQSGMSILEINLVTGFVPDTDSLYKVKSNEDSKILKIDVENNSVIFYFEEITNDKQNFSFQIQQIVEVNNRKPGLAKVYAYYAKDNAASTSYTVE
ncbi:alpha-1-macroglobulin isoform X1 [Parasteatoda tepidariorum]|uniref:alpha-1-macroglobulin isoform X3 n=2 Tax=Parasteatoda tepidariorum TaxID=114398 RepID=UPI001C71CFE8|nr:alpha-1-macroglobulin isoform X1 [Parasteatoda tepidariorum]XP_042903035.1 alpha-1-macroglobulin isoform X2 [Parasteatoda tepidariorum]